MKQILPLIYLTLANSVCVFAQTAILTAGADTANPTGSISYSIGQPFSEYTDSTNARIQQGVQQPYNIKVTKPPPQGEQANIDIFFAYPNPTNAILTLKRKGASTYAPQLPSNVRATLAVTPICTLYTLYGQILTTQPLTTQETQINMTNFKPGNYILRITQDNQEIATIKVVKI